MKQSAYPRDYNTQGHYGYRGSGKGQLTKESTNNPDYLIWKETDVIFTISVECYSGNDQLNTWYNKITTGNHRTYPNGYTINNNGGMNFNPYVLSGNKIGYENNRVAVMKFHSYGFIGTHGNPDQTCIGYYIPIKE